MLSLWRYGTAGTDAGVRSGLGDCGWSVSYRVGQKDDVVVGDEPLADGMHVAVRVRRDFTVTDAGRLLAAARAAYVQVNPGATADEAEAVVTSAADAIFTILESSGPRCFDDGDVFALPAGA